MLMAFLVCVAGSALAAPVVDSRIRLNTVGFLPTASKRASVAATCRDFTVIRASDGAEVFTGKAGEPSINADTGETLQVIDFTKVSEPGNYCLDVAGVGRSAPFRIGADVYD